MTMMAGSKDLTQFNMHLPYSYTGYNSGLSAISQKRIGFTASTVSAFLPPNIMKANPKIQYLGRDKTTPKLPC